MGLEHAYIKWIRRRLVKTPKSGCCGLVSLVSFIIGCVILPKVLGYMIPPTHSLILNRNIFPQVQKFKKNA